MYETILATTDGSEYARAAVEEAVRLAAEHGAALHVLAVVDRRVREATGLSTEELVTVESEDQCREHLADAALLAADADIECECKVSYGVPPERILAYADEIDADVIVLGTHSDHTKHLGGVGRAVRAGSNREIRVVDDRTTDQLVELHRT
ncbi:universal stress protein [Natrinema sp. 1APR25-10V2]|uniref:universal stress protein n=1 Tax=Natrinema sp. 1APR25-10V2 TaxID=2951081 RepID=UPI0028743368|nr:universal stress protein [Natrinema sp. 1APR25-10V2]MDS0477150.1 universal stress protein [Natrinema sp. 1APR25-10V2]